ncbi:hypothetical protein D3C81_1920320 [compost metagenome]
MRHDRGGLGVDHHDGLVADDHARVGVAFGRVGIGVVGQFFERDDLVVHIGVRGELLAHGGSFHCYRNRCVEGI